MANKTGTGQFRVHYLCTPARLDSFTSSMTISCDTVDYAIIEVKKYLRAKYGDDTRIVIGKTKVLRDRQAFVTNLKRVD